jgi:Multiubiquitin
MENVVTSGEGRDEKAKRQGPRRAGADGLFFTEVNGAIVKFSEPTPKGERVLDKAGCTPAGDYVLIQLLRHSSQSVGLDETVDLATEGTELFRAFKSDRIFRFTLNGHGFEWGVAKIPEPELRAVAHVPDDEIIVLEREGHDVALAPEDVLDLGGTGTEHLGTEKKLMTVYFENEPRELPRGALSPPSDPMTRSARTPSRPIQTVRDSLAKCRAACWKMNCAATPGSGRTASTRA